MSYPTTVTVGELLSFLNEQLAKGNVDAQTKVFVDVYSLTSEEEQLKARQGKLTPEQLIAEGLDYHIPDDNHDDTVNFRMGVWQLFPNGKARDATCENTMTFNIYVKQQSKPIRGARG